MIIEISLFIISISGVTFNYLNNKTNNRVLKAEIYRVEKALLETSINNNKMCSFIFQKVFDDNLNIKNKLLERRKAICPIEKTSFITHCPTTPLLTDFEINPDNDISPPFLDISEAEELENEPLLDENIKYTEINQLNKDFNCLKISYDLNNVIIE